MKVLALFQDIPRPDFDTLKKLEEEDKTSRATHFISEFNADVLDSKMLQQAPLHRRLLYKFLPVLWRQVIEAFCIFERYDVVLSWHEKIAFPFALLCKITGKRSVPHVALCSWPGRGFKGLMARLVQSHIDRFILWSSVQRRILLNEFGFPPSKISFIHYFVDDRFFRPINREADMICSVGSEMRDFPTLLEALHGLNIQCHVAAGTWNQKRSPWIRKLERTRNVPPNVTIGRKNALELRELYSRSRFVVIPLLESNTDNGITCILEAMAMGKAVICSRTQGQVDVIEDGKTGIFVPVGDAQALRSAVKYLWDNPDVADRLGRNGYRYIQQHQRLDRFVADIKCIIREVLEQRNAHSSIAGSFNPAAMAGAPAQSYIEPMDRKIQAFKMTSQ